jgi:hypothetical protein
LNSKGIDPADVKRVFRFVKRREWGGANRKLQAKARGFIQEVHLGNKFLAMESGAEGAADA